MRILLLLLLLVSPVLVLAQGGVPADPIKVIDSQGRPRGGAVVTICTSAGSGVPCTPLASIFLDAALTQPATNPTTTDGNGNLPVVYAAPGTYKYTVTGVGITTTGQPFTATVAGTGGGDAMRGQPNTFTAANAFTQPITAPALVSSSANPAATGFTRAASGDSHCWRNAANSSDLCLSKTAGDLLQWNADTIASLTAAQAFANHTFDISLNTLKTATNTAGHVPRNNGTQYADAQLGFSDLGGTASTAQIGTGTPASGKYVDGGTGAWTVIPSSGVSEATWSMTGINSPFTMTTAQVYAKTVLPSAHTLLRFTLYANQAPASCTTSPVLAFRDETTPSTLSSITVSNGTAFFDSGALNVAMTAGDTFGFELTTAGVGCSPTPNQWVATVVFK